MNKTLGTCRAKHTGDEEISASVGRDGVRNGFHDFLVVSGRLLQRCPAKKICKKTRPRRPRNKYLILMNVFSLKKNYFSLDNG
jgi:hypothetical protein